MRLEFNKIYNMDCIEYMKTLPKDSLNLIIADAPYFSTNIKEVGDKQWKTEEDYINWVIENFKEYERILKNNGSIYFFHNDINIMVEILHRIKKETNFKLKNQIIWDKLATGNQNFLMPLYKNSKIKRKYNTSLTEYIYYFTLQDGTGLDEVICSCNFKNVSSKILNYIDQKFDRNYIVDLFLKEGRYSNLQSAKVHASYKCGWNKGKRFDLMDEKLFSYLDEYLNFPFSYEELKQEYESIRKKEEENKYVFNQPYLKTPNNIYDSRNTIRPYSTVWHYKRDDEIYSKHVTPKPVAMIKHILNTSSKEGDLVYIPFAGSGSDIVACIETNRNYIATEINKKYIDEIILERIV